jgi:hypothetical protein
MVHITKVKTRARTLRNALRARDAPPDPTSRRYIILLYYRTRALGDFVSRVILESVCGNTGAPRAKPGHFEQHRARETEDGEWDAWSQAGGFENTWVSITI